MALFVLVLLQQPSTAAEVKAPFAIGAPGSHTARAFYNCCSLPEFMLLLVQDIAS